MRALCVDVAHPTTLCCGREQGLVFSSPFDDLSREHRSWLLAINIAVLLGVSPHAEGMAVFPYPYSPSTSPLPGLSCLIVRFAAPFRAEFAQCSEWMGNSTAVAGLSPSPCGGDCCLSTFLDCQECTRDAKACGGNSFPSSGDSSDVCTIYRCTAYVEECSGAGVFGSLLASEVGPLRPSCPAADRTGRSPLHSPCCSNRATSRRSC